MRVYLRLLLSLLVLIAGANAVLAVEPDEVLKDAGLEARARGLSAELRCLVCQNQSIDDSNAPLAKDLRLIVRERLKAGDSDTQVKEFLVARYGDFVLLKPPFAAYTLILWVSPLLVLLAAAYVARRSFGSRDTAPVVAPLSAAEQAKLDAVLGGPDAGAASAKRVAGKIGQS